MTFEVLFSSASRADLKRLLKFHVDRAETLQEFDDADQTILAVEVAVEKQLATTPYSFRKAAANSLQRELIIPSGSTGYIALFEIVSKSLVIVLAMRHQREDDYH